MSWDWKAAELVQSVRTQTVIIFLWDVDNIADKIMEGNQISLQRGLGKWIPHWFAQKIGQQQSRIGTCCVCIWPCCEKNTLSPSVFTEPPKVVLLSCRITPKALAVHSCCNPEFGLKQGMQSKLEAGWLANFYLEVQICHTVLIWTTLGMFTIEIYMPLYSVR